MSEQANDALVRRFMGEWSARHPDPEALLAYFTDDAVYHNMPSEPIAGTAAIAETFKRISSTMTCLGWEISYQVVNGDVVINERMDYWETSDGGRAELPVCGVFEIRDGKIAVWRDYFDTETLQSQLR